MGCRGKPEMSLQAYVELHVQPLSFDLLSLGFVLNNTADRCLLQGQGFNLPDYAVITKTQIFVLRAQFLCKQSCVAPSKRELGFLSKSPPVFPFIPPPALPTAPVPEAQHDPVWSD